MNHAQAATLTAASILQPARAPSEQILQLVARLTGQSVVDFSPATSGFTSACRGVAQLSNGSSVFVKAATDKLTAAWLRTEHKMYGLAASFMPSMLGWYDDGIESTMLLLEDLSEAFRPPPWTERMVEAVLAELATVRRTKAPAGLPSLNSMREILVGWRKVAEAPAQFLALGLCSQEWLNKTLPALIEAEDAADLTGDELLHFDVRSSNLCFHNGKVVLTDWNWACVGNGALEAIHWFPNLQLDGGPVKEAVIIAQPQLVALMTGYWASRAGLPAPEIGSKLRQAQLAQLKVILPWCVSALNLSKPY